MAAGGGGIGGGGGEWRASARRRHENEAANVAAMSKWRGRRPGVTLSCRRGVAWRRRGVAASNQRRGSGGNSIAGSVEWRGSGLGVTGRGGAGVGGGRQMWALAK